MPRVLGPKRSVVATFLAAGALVSSTLIAATPAQADRIWPTWFTQCPTGKWLILDFKVDEKHVSIGWGPTEDSASANSNPYNGGPAIIYAPGGSIATQQNYTYWRVWPGSVNGGGHVTSWTKRCVNFV
jgi:hypothetical protein